MQDRQPGAPGQYKATVTAAELQKLQAGEQFTITMVRDDQPVVEGTPYSKAAVLPDALAAIICPDVLNPTPADALSALLPRNGKAAMTNHLPMGGHKVTGLGMPAAEGDAVPLGYANQNFAPAVESADYPGCYYRTVNGVVEWINPPMVVGVEYRTAERCDGKVVYARYIDCGAASPGTAIAVYPSIGKPIRWSGRTEHGAALPFQPYVTDRSMDITIGVQENTIFISAGSQQTAAKIYVSVWYVKD